MSKFASMARFLKISSSLFILVLTLSFHGAFATTFLDSIQLGGEGGRATFIGDLRKETNPSWYGNLTLEYPCAPRLFGYMEGGYSYIPVTNGTATGLHQFSGRAGLQTLMPLFTRLSAGGGITLSAARGYHMDKSYLLSTSESEFGWNARISCHLVKVSHYQIGFRAHWDHLWTTPEATNIVWAGFFVEAFPW